MPQTNDTAEITEVVDKYSRIIRMVIGGLGENEIVQITILLNAAQQIARDAPHELRPSVAQLFASAKLGLEATWGDKSKDG